MPQHRDMQLSSQSLKDRPALGWPGPAVVLSLVIALYLLGQEAGLASTVLRGSTSRTEAVAVTGRPYHPHQSSILYADQLAEDYKLQAAEAIYRRALQKNPRNAGALNGLGKIAYYKTTSSNQNYRGQTDALYEEAIHRFSTALRYQPGYVEAHVNLASVYMEQGRMGEAADELYRALHLAPSNNQALAHKGEWLVRQKQYNEAFPYLRKAIRLNSANVTAHYYLGVAHAARNEQNEALQEFNTTLWLQPRNGNAHYQMALIYEQQGNGAAAVEHYLQAVALKPELNEARMKLADYYQRRDDQASALEQLKNVMDTGNPDWALTDRIGKLSMANEQPEVAVKVYRKWLKAHPEDTTRVNAAISVAKTQLAKKKLRDSDLISQGEAHRYAEQAGKYQPNNVEARMIKAKLDKEIGTATPIQGKDPSIIDAALSQPAYQPYQNYEKGEILLARYQFHEAKAAFRTARRSGEGKRSVMNYGELFLTIGLPGLAEEAFQQVLHQLPDNASARLGMAKAREAREQSNIWVQEAKLNRKKEALPVAVLLLERALKANAENAQAHQQLAEIYERQEDYAGAADHYYALLQLDPKPPNAEGLERKISQLKRKALEQKNTGGR